MPEITIKKPKVPRYDCEEIKLKATPAELYIIFMLETICTKLKIPFDPPV